MFLRFDPLPVLTQNAAERSKQMNKDGDGRRGILDDLEDLDNPHDLDDFEDIHNFEDTHTIDEREGPSDRRAQSDNPMRGEDRRQNPQTSSEDGGEMSEDGKRKTDDG